jgi:hypothetical protein
LRLQAFLRVLQIDLICLFDHTRPVRQRNELSRRFAVRRSHRQLEAAGSKLSVFQHDREFVGRVRKNAVRKPLYLQAAVRGIRVAVGMTYAAVGFAKTSGMSRWRAIFISVAETAGSRQEQDCYYKE